jgi:hypothetical protein
MRVAFHFDADAYDGFYGLPIEEMMFKALLAAIPVGRRHVRIRHGDLLLHSYGARTRTDLEDRALRLLARERSLWSTLDAETFPRLARETNVYVLDVTGLTPLDARRVDAELRRLDEKQSYFGALQVDPAVDVHWVFYDQSLPDAYRVAGDELRLLHEAAELEGDRDEGMLAHWREGGLFTSVIFEDIGLQGTIFDPYDTREYAQRLAELESQLTTQFAVVANETLMRTGDLDPRLRDMLHAAFTAVERVETNEQLSHAALSCRRFLERLADALYPPREVSEGERKLGGPQYRNRLWAYIAAHLEGRSQEVVLASLKDVGGRIDKLDALANKGVHGAEISAAELQRLLVGLTTLTFDVLTIAPPQDKPLYEPYEKYLFETLGEMVSPPPEPEAD